MIGQTISHYRVLEQLGEGGMGVVYRAEDTKLERTVALKFLAAHLLNDAEAKERFLREAKAAAALHHPNICPVHEIDEAGGRIFLSMALIEGETLEDRIARGPLPIKEALDIGQQIAKGLQVAHEKGIVHRDIKPANLMVAQDGQVTIMDFGLARLTEASLLTMPDTAMGTAAYMSPEQAQGAPVDHRTDLWALGCVLYEMIAGIRPFRGDSYQALLYEVVQQEAEPLTGVRAGVPLELEFIVGKCLAKERDDRTGSAQEVARELRTLAEKVGSGRSAVLATALLPRPGSEPARPAVPTDPALARPVSVRNLRLAQALAAAGLIACTVLAFLHFSEAPVERPVSQWSFAPLDLVTGSQPVAVSPNGRHIVYEAGPGVPRLWVRDLDRLEPRELVGTEGGTRPFWSPDSRFIGFAAGSELRKISVQGGPPISLCSLTGDFWGGSWSPDGESVAFSLSEGGGARVFEVSADSGKPKLLFEPQEPGPGSYNSHPHFLPLEAAARSLLLRVPGETGREVAVKNLDTGEIVILAPGEHPVYSSSGHIVYDHQNSLWAIPFSLDGLAATGAAFPIVENSRSASVAQDGTLVSLLGSGAALRIGGQPSQLIWRDRTGEMLGELGSAQGGIRSPALSPDGGSVAVEAWEGGDYDQSVWVHEVDRQMKRRLTLGAASGILPQWSPSGRELTYGSTSGGSLPGLGTIEQGTSWNIYRRAADGTGEAELLVGTEADEFPYGWSHDGDYLVYTTSAEGNSDIWYLRKKVDGQGFESVPYLDTPFAETVPALSPDGGFLAYCSDQSGEDQVYVQPFPGGEGRWQVSTIGGCQPRWSRDGKELFFVEGGNLVAVEIDVSPGFVVGESRTLFSSRILEHGYDVSSDGHFVMVEPVESAEGAPAIQVLQNWYEAFRDRGRD